MFSALFFVGPDYLATISTLRPMTTLIKFSGHFLAVASLLATFALQSAARAATDPLANCRDGFLI